MVSKIAIAVLCLSLASLCILKVKAEDEATTEVPDATTQAPVIPPPCNPLHAVFTVYGARWFVYGRGFGMMTAVNSLGEIVYHNSQNTYDTLFYSPITAGAGIIDYTDEFYFLYSGSNEFVYPKDPNGYDIYPFHYSGAYDDLVKTNGKGRIDAAYTGTNSTITYFDGCDYIQVDAKYLTIVGQGKNADVGLPCYVDAAWRSTDFTIGYISKGDQVYLWHEGQDKVMDPVNVYLLFPYMKLFNLCSS